MSIRSPEVPSKAVTAAVLAGGKSLRFGSDKALAMIPDTGETFLERAIGLARAVANDVLVIGSDRALHTRDVPRYVPDCWPDQGPVGGVLTALEAAQTRYLLVLSCDQPMILASDVMLLLEFLPGRRAAAFAARDLPLHPLPCAFDVPQCRPRVTDMFTGGVRSLIDVLQRCDAGLVRFADSDEAMSRVLDIDTQQELDRIIDQRFHKFDT